MKKLAFSAIDKFEHFDSLSFCYQITCQLLIEHSIGCGGVLITWCFKVLLSIYTLVFYLQHYCLNSQSYIGPNSCFPPVVNVITHPSCVYRMSSSHGQHSSNGQRVPHKQQPHYQQDPLQGYSISQSQLPYNYTQMVTLTHVITGFC